MSKLVSTLLAGILLTLTYPVAAGASVSWVVHGRGFGHGVGMSAYGAYGYAKHGKTYRFIGLRFRNVILSSVATWPSVALGIATKSGSISDRCLARSR